MGTMMVNNSERMNTVRWRARWIYLLIGIVLLGVFCIREGSMFLSILCKYLSAILWSASWSFIGIGLGLWFDPKNDPKDHKANKKSHYVTYFPFVLFISFCAAFSVLLATPDLKSYILSALTGTTIGFAGDALGGLILKVGRFPGSQ